MASKSAARSAAGSGTARESISLRIPGPTLQLIDQAAKTLGKTRTEFLIEGARVRAEDVLLERKVFLLPSAQFDRVLALLDNPPAPAAKLRKLMRAKTPWA